MTDLPINPIRASFSILAIMCMSSGALILWGWGGWLFAFGLFMAIDLGTDEALERITKTTRGKISSPETDNQQ